MKGIILAGGLGTRLHPLTRVTNKCLLPVYDRPMIFWPIQTLVNSGINDIMIVCGGNAAGDFLRILGNGEDFGLSRLHYAYQSEPRGIADALKMAEAFAGNDPIMVILADNIFGDTFEHVVKRFPHYPADAMIFIKEVARPEWYGVVEVEEGEGHPIVTSIEEKPQCPKAKTIATGLYVYGPVVWNFIDSLTPSARGELEITDLNNHFLDQGTLYADYVPGYWGDAGESLDVYNQSCADARELFGNRSIDCDGRT